MAEPQEPQSPQPESAPAPTPRPGFARRHWGKLTLLALIAGPIAIVSLWAMAALSYSYSTGTRTGYVQKLSKRGWICKTHEGELAMVQMPGQPAMMFAFTVRDDAVVRRIEELHGHRVVLEYDQHRGLPTSCFGETEYFVKEVRKAE